eukprot:scaffold98_cov248-Ochromonas_danica.AAC.13
MKRKLIEEENNLVKTTFELGKRYPLSILDTQSGLEAVILQYGFKPANVDNSQDSVMQIITTTTTTRQEEGNVTLKSKSNENKDVSFRGNTLSSLSGNSQYEYLLSYEKDQQCFQLTKVTQNITNLRPIREQDNLLGEVTSSQKANPSSSSVTQSLKKMMQGSHKKSSTKSSSSQSIQLPSSSTQQQQQADQPSQSLPSVQSGFIVDKVSKRPAASSSITTTSSVTVPVSTTNPVVPVSTATVTPLVVTVGTSNGDLDKKDTTRTEEDNTTKDTNAVLVPLASQQLS